MDVTEIKYQKYLPKDYKSANPIRWCPGCGDFAVLACLQKAMAELNIEPHDAAVISGIGCSSRLPYYIWKTAASSPIPAPICITSAPNTAASTSRV